MVVEEPGGSSNLGSVLVPVEPTMVAAEVFISRFSRFEFRRHQASPATSVLVLMPVCFRFRLGTVRSSRRSRTLVQFTRFGSVRFRFSSGHVPVQFRFRGILGSGFGSDSSGSSSGQHQLGLYSFQLFLKLSS
ncbi:hypothetical protein Hanom_Chr02g00126691 [Helianthus anomalus]